MPSLVWDAYIRVLAGVGFTAPEFNPIAAFVCPVAEQLYIFTF